MDTSGSVFGAVSSVFDLSGPRRSIFIDFKAFSREDQGEFLKITANLLKQGIVGNETVRVNGRPVTTDVTTRLGDERLRNAPAYRGPGGVLDLRA
jgi:hypothetical protein